MVESAGAVEYDCFSAEGQDSPNECPIYDSKKTDGEVPVMLEFKECGVPLYCNRSQVLSDLERQHLIRSYLWFK